MEIRGLKIGRENIENWKEKLMGKGNETTGDHYNCPCPYCGKNNCSVTDNVAVAISECVTFEKPCFYCKEVIFYKVELSRTVIAKAPGTEPKFPITDNLYKVHVYSEGENPDCGEEFYTTHKGVYGAARKVIDDLTKTRQAQLGRDDYTSKLCILPPGISARQALSLIKSLGFNVIE